MTSEASALVIALIGILGVLVGSFLNVVIHRVPEGRSIVRPPSACPACGGAIRPRDNVPVLSWLVLRGRCRSCGASISARYPAVELVTGLLWAGLTAWALATEAAVALLPLVLVLAAAGIALTVIDIDHHRLPDRIVLPLYPVVVVGLVLAGVVSGSWPLGAAAIGAVLWLVVVGLPWLVSGGRGMGFGDVKLAPLLGAVLGWWSVASAVVGLFAAFVLGAMVGLALILTRRAGRRTALPFGPFLLAGALVGLLVGPAVGTGYLAWLAGS